jgi:quercetin dioxygenase-like cupin family protein
MNDNAGTGRATVNAGAAKGGVDGYVFDLGALNRIDAGTGYSTAVGSLVEGERMQVGLMHKARGTGARPHSHPNEQWNYVVQGRLRVSIEGEPERIAGPGTLIYFPANKVHATVALPDEDGLSRREGPLLRGHRPGGGRHDVRPALRARL